MANASLRLAPPRLTRDALNNKHWVLANDGGYILASEHNLHSSDLPASFFSIIAHVEELDDTPIPESYRPAFMNTYKLRLGPSSVPERARSFLESIRALQLLQDNLGPDISVDSPINNDSTSVHLQLNVPIANNEGGVTAIPLTLFDDTAKILPLTEHMHRFLHADVDFMVVLRQFISAPAVRQIRAYTQLARLCV
ncbi:hypothetical protein BDN72DRAFT_865460 [Pluteus cervinus]|uniref:Uncharacterized protein n=1 Tax=Pluteus cervinus TaxID=181527 RepID=A0ACD3A2D6_9AGAR|nr:hypothetical protein BDN72DRAFT_865460 [Pluteus cervinus]